MTFVITFERIIVFSKIGHTGPVNCVVILANGSEIISGSSDSKLRRWSVQTGQVIQVYEGHTDWVNCVALLPNNHIVSGSFDKSIKIWDRLTGVCLHTLTGHTNWVSDITVCSNGDVVSASNDGSLRVWRARSTRSGQYVCHQILANAHSFYAYCVTTVPGTDDVVSGGYENDGTGSLKLWQRPNPTSDYTCVRTFKGHTRAVWSVAVMANQNIVSGSLDKTVKVWSRDTGDCLHTLIGHTNYISSVAVSPYNELVTASDDNTLKIWD